MCAIIKELAAKHPKSKFLKSIASLCVANFPETSLPTIFVYRNGILQKQLIIPQTLGRSNIDIECESINDINEWTDN